MNLDKKYFGLDEKEYNILEMVQKYPEWAANRIQEGEKAIAELKKTKEFLKAIKMDEDSWDSL